MRNRIHLHDERLKLAAEAAHTAAFHAYSIKDKYSPSEADDVVGETVRRRLTEASEYPVFGEEHGWSEGGEQDSYWIVDPIDGTQNFAYGQLDYGTSVAFVEDSEPVLGVFYMPEHDLLYYGLQDEGAFCNQRRLAVTDSEAVSDAYVSVNGVNSGQSMSSLVESFPTVWFNRGGCAIQSQAYVAAGNYDGAIFSTLQPWDFATGYVLVTEANGIVKHLRTGETDWNAIKNGVTVMGSENFVSHLFEQIPEDVVEIYEAAEY